MMKPVSFEEAKRFGGYAVLCGLLLGLAWSVYDRSERTMVEQRRNAALRAMIAEREERVDMLAAEIGYLLNVDRLRRLAVQFPDFARLTGASTMSYDRLKAIARRTRIGGDDATQ